VSADAEQSSSNKIPGAQTVWQLATQVGRVASATASLAGETGRVVAGTSEVEPEKGDKRFKDPTWDDHPLYRRLKQEYLACQQAIDEFVKGTDLNWRDKERVKFVADVLTSALSPTNSLLGNPAALKRAFETGGGSVLSGLRNWVGDLRSNNGMPSHISEDALVVGRDLALTPGAVVDRDEVAEVIQYTPTTAKVHKRPLVIVVPQINKYYFMDLSPERSFVEYAVANGLQVFTISWHNPGPEQADWDLDTYAGRVLSVIDVARDITGSPDVNLMGLCAGGITAATALNHLAATGDERVASISHGVTLLDWDVPAQVGMLQSETLLKLASATSDQLGVLDGASLGSVFTWMRPDDLVWTFWVNNYLMGNDPPTFDILAWNNDPTNLPAALHDDFLHVFENNSLAQAGEKTVLGSPIDLSKVTVPSYITGGTTDHLTPWRGCYASTQLYGGPTTFTLTNTGHIQTMVCPPGQSKSRYWVGPEPGPDADAWVEQAEERQGTWWEHWLEWILERSGDEKQAPKKPGNRKHPAITEAPGTYVFEDV
jgi:polyhydroxyalkanoate synthase subunit PhaC